MKILAIDPGTHCGWAIRTDIGTLISGVWNLQTSRHEGGGMRFVKLRKSLLDVLQSETPDVVVYEEVRRHLGTDAAHVYGGIISHIGELCENLKIPYMAIPVAKIKKHATGKGNADKNAMIAAARTRWPVAVIKDDNEADARWIAETAAVELITKSDGAASARR